MYISCRLIRELFVTELGYYALLVPLRMQWRTQKLIDGGVSFPSLHLPSPLPRLHLEVAPLNQLGGLAELRPKTNLVHSRAVRKPLVAIILSILKCLFYSKSIKI